MTRRSLVRAGGSKGPELDTTGPGHDRRMPSLDRLSAEDRLILWPDGMAQDIGAVAILDWQHPPRPRWPIPDRGGEAGDRRSAAVPPTVRQVLYVPRRRLGGPLWVDAPAFDLDDHVRVEQLPAAADEAELLRTVARLRRRRLDRSRPLWEMWFLPGLPGDRIGWFIRLHHVMADGIAGVAELGALLDAVPSAATAPAPPWIRRAATIGARSAAGQPPARIAKLRKAARGVTHPAAILHRVRAGMPAFRELLAEKPGPETSLNRVIGPDRTLAVLRSSLGWSRTSRTVMTPPSTMCCWP